MIKKLLLLVVVIIPASYYLLTPGFYEPHDLHHIADIYQMIRAINSGQFPPRLGPDYIFGYGYPLFNFYYVFPFYLGAIFFFLVGSLTLSFKLVLVLSILLSVIGMYLFLKELLGEYSAFIGSVLFLYTPYRSVQIYVRGAMGEAFALSILPLFAWSIVRLIKNPRLTNAAVMGLIGSIFILSHNYFWVLAFPWLFALVFLVGYKEKVLVWSRLFLGWIIAMALSFYWWFPALIEQRFVSTKTPFPILDHFPFIRQLILPSWGYGASLWGPDDGLSFQMGVVNLATFLIFVLLIPLYFRRLKSQRLLPLALWLIAGFAASFFMMNIRSYPLWKLIPFYNFVQFPWRHLSFTTFFTSIVGAVVVAISPSQKKHIAGFLIIFFSILLTINYFKPSQKFFKKDDDYLRRFFADRTISGQSEGLSKEYLLYSEDYLQLPNWLKERPNDISLSKITSEDAKIFDVTQINSVSWTAKVIAKDLSKITFHALYFPGWKAKVDDEEVSTTLGEPNGQIEIYVKGGDHNIKFFWQETNLRKFADFVSLGALVSTIVIFVLRRRNEK